MNTERRGDPEADDATVVAARAKRAPGAGDGAGSPGDAGKAGGDAHAPADAGDTGDAGDTTAIAPQPVSEAPTSPAPPPAGPHPQPLPKRSSLRPRRSEREPRPGGLGGALPGATADGPTWGNSSLDPARPIRPAPGMLPWDPPRDGERGLSQGVPVSYVARPLGSRQSVPVPDEVQRRLGPPPEAAPVSVRQGREALPSVQRRARRSRRFGLIGFATAIVISVSGLWVIARLALG